MAHGERQSGPNAASHAPPPPTPFPSASAGDRSRPAPTPATPAPTLTTRCPRCGYDLRGTVATWTESCPLTGVCSECGLEFPWRELLVTDHFGEYWNIERQPSRRRLPLAALQTYLRSFGPWSFWSRLRMSHVILPGRLATYLAALAASLLLLYPFVQITGAVVVRYRAGQTIDDAIQRVSANIAYLTARAAAGVDDAEVRAAATAVDPALLAHLERLDDLQRAQVLGQFRAGLPAVQARVMPVSYWDAILEVLLTPTESSSAYIGTYRPYVPPAYLYDEIAGHLQGQGTVGAVVTWKWYGGGQFWRRMLIVPVLGGALLLFTMLIPLWFAVLPASRRSARVFWPHIGRVAAYSVFLTHAFIVASVMLLWWAYLFAPSRIDMATAAPVPFALAAAVGLVVFWASATRRYLRLPHGWLIAVLFALLSVLLIVLLRNLWVGWLW